MQVSYNLSKNLRRKKDPEKAQKANNAEYFLSQKG